MRKGSFAEPGGQRGVHRDGPQRREPCAVRPDGQGTAHARVVGAEQDEGAGQAHARQGGPDDMPAEDMPGVRQHEGDRRGVSWGGQGLRPGVQEVPHFLPQIFRAIGIKASGDRRLTDKHGTSQRKKRPDRRSRPPVRAVVSAVSVWSA